MTDPVAVALLIWAGGAAVAGLALAFRSGWTGDEADGFGLLLAVVWPLTATVVAMFGPFWLAYRLGAALRPKDASE